MINILKRISFYFHNFSVYKAVALIGYLLRIILLPIVIPNIFEVVAEFFILKLHLPQWAYEVLIRLAIAFIDHFSLNLIFYIVTYGTVGLFYEPWSEPVWGSITYTIFYFVYMAIPVIFFNWFYWWVIAVTFTAYALLCAGAYVISAMIGALSEGWIGALILHLFIFVVVVVGVCLIKGLAF